VRRLLASLLLLLTGLLPVQPLLADAVAASHLPACCRRMGAHHCLMRDLAWVQRSATEIPRHVQAPFDPCPWRFVRAGSVAPLFAPPSGLRRDTFNRRLTHHLRPVPSQDRHLRLRLSRAPPADLS
jgi:hypothetical protein